MITIGIDANSCVRWTFIFNDEHEALCARAKMLANIEKCEREVTLHHLIRGIVVKFIPPFKLTNSQIYIFTRAELDTCFEKFELKPGMDPLTKTKVLSVNAPRINYAQHPVKIKEDLNMIDYNCWRSSCDERTRGYIANDKPKANYVSYNRSNLMSITKVIFNPPATIVFWGDGSKTVVKCGPDDKFNPHVGIAMCVMKKVYGSRRVNGEKVIINSGEAKAYYHKTITAWNFHGVFRKWADPWLKKQEEEAYKPNGIAPDVILKDFSDRMGIAISSYWNNVLKNFESASDDQKAEDDKEK